VKRNFRISEEKCRLTRRLAAVARHGGWQTVPVRSARGNVRRVKLEATVGISGRSPVAINSLDAAVRHRCDHAKKSLKSSRVGGFAVAMLRSADHRGERRAARRC
jgi:hypothetical protein